MKLLLVSFTLIYSTTCSLVVSFHINVCFTLVCTLMFVHVLREALVYQAFLCMVVKRMALLP